MFTNKNIHNKTIYIKGLNIITFSKVSLVMLILVLGVFVVSNLAVAKMYRWVDKTGKVHYSQSIPPSQAQHGHKELNEPMLSPVRSRSNVY